MYDGRAAPTQVDIRDIFYVTSDRPAASLDKRLQIVQEAKKRISQVMPSSLGVEARASF